LAAIGKLAIEAADNGLVPPPLAYVVERMKGVKQEGVRAGNHSPPPLLDRILGEF
jgi:hypothetical protein